LGSVVAFGCSCGLFADCPTTSAHRRRTDKNPATRGQPWPVHHRTAFQARPGRVPTRDTCCTAGARRASGPVPADGRRELSCPDCLFAGKTRFHTEIAGIGITVARDWGWDMNDNDFAIAVGEAAQDAVWSTPHQLPQRLADDDPRRRNTCVTCVITNCRSVAKCWRR
jgi:hypothetical protein